MVKGSLEKDWIKKAGSKNKLRKICRKCKSNLAASPVHLEDLLEQLCAEGTAAADIATAQPHSGDSCWEVPATPEMQMAVSRSRRKAPDHCASLSLLLEKHPGEHQAPPRCSGALSSFPGRATPK